MVLVVSNVEVLFVDVFTVNDVECLVFITDEVLFVSNIMVLVVRKIEALFVSIVDAPVADVDILIDEGLVFDIIAIIVSVKKEFVFLV